MQNAKNGKTTTPIVFIESTLARISLYTIVKNPKISNRRENLVLNFNEYKEFHGNRTSKLVSNTRHFEIRAEMNSQETSPLWSCTQVMAAFKLWALFRVLKCCI